MLGHLEACTIVCSIDEYSWEERATMDLTNALLSAGLGVVVIALSSLVYVKSRHRKRYWTLADVRKLLGLTLYRLLLHPFARIPGDFLQKISGWPRIYHSHQGDRYLREAETHQKYGSVIRIAPNSVS